MLKWWNSRVSFQNAEEFVAHGSNVSCLSLGPSSGRVMVTGGEDRKVNMWAVGKPNVILVRVVLSYLIVLLWNGLFIYLT